MKEIFTDLYKKVLGFFQTQEKTEEVSESKNVAVNRMKLVLMQDRTNLTPYLLERMRGEMIDVLAKYVEMDKEALELNFEQEGEQMALMLSIPVIRAKEEDEIVAILNAEDEAKAEEEANEETGEEPANAEAEEESAEAETDSETKDDSETEEETVVEEVIEEKAEEVAEESEKKTEPSVKKNKSKK